MNRDFVALSLLLLVSANSAFAVEANCAGADLSKLASVVYVSPQGADSANCGQNATAPCKTIQQGITNCHGDACGVLVRYGTYNVTAPVQLVDGVSLYGSCIFDEMPYRYRSMIVGRPAVRAENIKKLTTLYGFVILGSSPGNAGEASVALLLTNSTGLTLSHDVIASGKGANGAIGTSRNGSTGGYGRYSSSNSGGAGGKACNANTPLNSPGDGGKGADYQQLASSGCFALCKCDNNNYPASLGQKGQSSGTVEGGGGAGRGGAGCMCDPNGGNAGEGGTGTNGSPGTCSASVASRNPDTKGTFNGITWTPNRGGDGSVGQVGSGGGGGGSGGFGVFYRLFEKAIDYPGSPGGGGGGGGCGGPGGQGGQQGGASIPVVLANSSTITIDAANALIPGPGGAGGTGGGGGKGGAGGSGVTGGRFQRWIISGAACNGTVPGYGGTGGNGGQGGAGSGGAGGNGGPSFAIALVNSPPLSIAGLSIYAAQPGAGGAPGPGGQNDSSQCKGGNGQEGVPGFSNNQNSVVSYTTADAAGSSL
jgi:hypothetical protein